MEKAGPKRTGQHEATGKISGVERKEGNLTCMGHNFRPGHAGGYRTFFDRNLPARQASWRRGCQQTPACVALSPRLGPLPQLNLRITGQTNDECKPLGSQLWGRELEFARRDLSADIFETL